MSGPYDDLIDLPHPVSRRHPRMTMSDRAAQFSPFAALNGFEDAIRENGRYTGRKEELDENMLELLDQKWEELEREGRGHSQISIVYFVPDGRKAGGFYKTVTGNVKKVDRLEKTLILEDGRKIPLEDILEIDSFR